LAIPNSSVEGRIVNDRHAHPAGRRVPRRRRDPYSRTIARLPERDLTENLRHDVAVLVFKAGHAALVKARGE
jgi:hypothetical protein